MKSKLRLVEKVAHDVRNWAEKKAGEGDDLCGFCAIASAELHRRLKKLGIETELHLWDDSDYSCHVFLVVDDYVVDVTATQFWEFNNRRVVVLPKKAAEAYEFYNTSAVFKEPPALKRWQKKTGWPEDQMVLAA